MVRFNSRLTVGILFTLLLAGPALAQEVEIKEPGIKVGRLRIRPGLGLDYAFDSNLFLRDDGEGPGPRAAHRLHIIPSISLTSAPEAPVDFSLGLSANYNLYLSSDASIRNLSDAAVNANLSATFNPRGDVSFSIIEEFRRTTAAPTVELPQPFNRNTNRVGAKLGINPGGRALIFELFYFYLYDSYENFGFGSGTAQSLDNQQHQIKLRSRWKFLPKTAFVAEVSGNLWRWDQEAFNNANIFRISAGLVGNLTARLTLTARLGYGHSFHSNGPSFNSAFGEVEAEYRFLRSLTARLGYARDFLPSAYGNYFDDHKIYLNVEANLWRRLRLDLRFTYFRVAFAENPDPSILAGGGVTLISEDARRDNIYQLQLGARFLVWRWLSAQLRYQLGVRTSNNGLQYTDPQGGSFVDRFNYLQHIVTIGLLGRY